MSILVASRASVRFAVPTYTTITIKTAPTAVTGQPAMTIPVMTTTLMLMKTIVMVTQEDETGDDDVYQSERERVCVSLLMKICCCIYIYTYVCIITCLGYLVSPSVSLT